MSDHNIEIREAFNAWAEAQNPKIYPAEWQAFQAGWQAALESPEVQAVRDALENLLNVHDGKGGTAYPADEIARAALAREQGGSDGDR